MKHSKLTLLPLDDRPVNYDYPVLLGKIGGISVDVPPREWLGNPWRNASRDQLSEWLFDKARSSDGLIISIDALIFGGLIASRKSDETFEELINYFEILKNIRCKYPSLLVDAFSVIQRVSRENSCEEEKSYWKLYGKDFFRLSYLEDKIFLNEHSLIELQEYNQLKQLIPNGIREDYKRTRLRNKRINKYALDLLSQDVLNYLILAQDDTADYGWNIADRRELQEDINHLSLEEKAITYPGTDEIGCVLLARFACNYYNLSPKFSSLFSAEQGREIVTAFEDRSLDHLLKAHLHPVGGKFSEIREEADCLLFFNAPVDKQGDGILQWLVENNQQLFKKQLPPEDLKVIERFFHHPSFNETAQLMRLQAPRDDVLISMMKNEKDCGKLIALADVAFYNAADLYLIRNSLWENWFTGITAYAGWNTSGNTLGTVLAHCCLRMAAKKTEDNLEANQAHYSFLLLRILEDYAYQAIIRSKILFEDWPVPGSGTLERIEDEYTLSYVSQMIEQQIHDFCEELASFWIARGLIKNVELRKVWLPWNRLFEVGIEVEVKL